MSGKGAWESGDVENQRVPLRSGTSSAV